MVNKSCILLFQSHIDYSSNSSLDTVPTLPFATYQVLLLVFPRLNSSLAHLQACVIFKWKRLAGSMAAPSFNRHAPTISILVACSHRDDTRLARLLILPYETMQEMC